MFTVTACISMSVHVRLINSIFPSDFEGNLKMLYDFFANRIIIILIPLDLCNLTGSILKDIIFYLCQNQTHVHLSTTEYMRNQLAAVGLHMMF